MQSSATLRRTIMRYSGFPKTPFESFHQLVIVNLPIVHGDCFV